MRKLGVQASIALVLLALQLPSAMQDAYNLITGFLCVRSDFIETPSGSNTVTRCALMCNRNQRCQAFSLADGPCQLFVFDKCSKSVRDCGCSRTGQLFVKQQAGLEAGALCPSGYGDDLCGVKYKLLANGELWWPSRARCESESGLVIMADVTDAAEMSRVNSIFDQRANGQSFWLGGLQPAGSPEPLGGWHWVACNISVDSSLWANGEPTVSEENVIGRYHMYGNLSDFRDFSSTPRAVLCECLSPFG